MTAPSPKDRYATADDLIADLDSFLAGTKISSRLPRWFTAAMAAATILIGATLWFAAPWRPSESGARINAEGIVIVDGPLPAPFEGPAAETAVRAAQKTWATALGSPVEIRNTLGMTFRLIPPGTMPLGTPACQIDDRLAQLVPGTADWQWLRTNGPKELPQRRVTLAQPYYLGSTEVTVAQFRKFVDATGHQTSAETDGRGGV